ISRRPWTVRRALPWDTRTSVVGVGLRQATSHPEVLPSSTRLACYQPPGRVHLGTRPSHRRRVAAQTPGTAESALPAPDPQARHGRRIATGDSGFRVRATGRSPVAVDGAGGPAGAVSGSLDLAEDRALGHGGAGVHGQVGDDAVLVRGDRVLHFH